MPNANARKQKIEVWASIVLKSDYTRRKQLFGFKFNSHNYEFCSWYRHKIRIRREIPGEPISVCFLDSRFRCVFIYDRVFSILPFVLKLRFICFWTNGCPICDYLSHQNLRERWKSVGTYIFLVECSLWMNANEITRSYSLVAEHCRHCQSENNVMFSPQHERN